MTNNKQKLTERESTSIVVIILTIASLILFIVGAAMLFTWVANSDKPSIEYEDEIIAGACKDLGISTDVVKEIRKIDEYLYIMNTDTNAYLVGIKLEDGKVVYVDVERSLL